VLADLPLRSAAFGVICPSWGHVVAQRTEAALPREPSGAAALLVSAATMLCALAAGMDGRVGNGWAIEAD
jgi:hypothetical protein